MAISGWVERSDGVQHLVVRRMENYGELLEGLAVGSRDFH
jgi:error-prone DNA polymerase